jgi:hypothetical protein
MDNSQPFACAPEAQVKKGGLHAKMGVVDSPLLNPSHAPQLVLRFLFFLSVNAAPNQFSLLKEESQAPQLGWQSSSEGHCS